jgi:predicted nucleic acid-binding protein
MIAVADTGFVVAIANVKDAAHIRCLSVYRSLELIYVPQSTLAEAMYLITEDRGNYVAALALDSIINDEKYRLTPLDNVDLSRTVALLKKYSDSRLDFVDASVIAVAERLTLDTILTLDQRDFRMVRPYHIPAFDLLPEIM